jgi:hypothetical protein
MEALQQCGAFSLLNTSRLLCAMRYILFSTLLSVTGNDESKHPG